MGDGRGCYAWRVIGRLVRVARPDDWTGSLARLAIVVALGLLVILVLLVRLPAAWVALAGGRPVLVRVALSLLVLLLLRVGATVLYARLPRAVHLRGRRLRFHDGTRRVVVRVDEIAALHIELRPPPAHEVGVIERTDGAEHDLCPLHWGGAPALYRELERKVAAAHRRRARARARAVRGRVRKSASA